MFAEKNVRQTPYRYCRCKSSSAGILLAPADFPFLSDANVISISSRRTGYISSSVGGGADCNSHGCIPLGNMLSIRLEYLFLC